ncbi:MAG: helix-turn-helix transcriptional regulator [Prolixibacteraceae bacterium]|nr:helix-turn-helix transcriptional regulator [Prolixibacteraceae bacterium]MBN2774405.1 helix-turn-helix transcriptional regulator [Prolixibacteraceae bacterium]
MKQPELGNQISETRKIKGYTQLELAEECNVDIRTIQRIESGEVTPRLFTLRIINEKLGTNFDLNGDSGIEKIDGSKMAIKTGWISGIVLFLLLPVMVIEAVNFLRLNTHNMWPLFPLIIYICIHILSVVFFYRAIFLTGSYLNNVLLKAGAVITIVVVALMNFSKIILFFIGPSIHVYLNAVQGAFIGVSTIIVGTGFMLIKKFQPSLALAIGIIQIITGVFYVFAGIIGIILGAISLVLQIIYLAMLEKELKS